MTHKIRLHNTKTRLTEDFSPLQEGRVGIYSCGPTVYHYAHIGNLRAYVFADVLRRMFTYTGYAVTHIINITDVGHIVGEGDNGEDKIEYGSKREGLSAWEVAKKYTDAYLHDLESLNIPTENYIFPRATDHIQEQLGLVEALEIAGHTYKITDGIYFDTSTFPSYADFAHLNIEGLQSGARVEENPEKRNITDFALWKFSPKDEKRQMEWESKWGMGFPGWHIECSAMSMKYLGNHFDIHTGGIDHIPVHHTNEIAQSESVTGETYVNYWMHSNFLNDQTGKMSKSNGDFLRLKTLHDEGFSSLSYRYHLLTTHYRAELAFSFESLQASSQAYEKLVEFVRANKDTSGAILDTYRTMFEEAILDDLGTPAGIAVVWKMVKDASISNADKVATLFLFDKILGLKLEESSKEQKTVLIIPEEVQNLLEERKNSRETKNFQESDRLRVAIHALGFIVKDTSEGQQIEAI